MFWFYVKVLSLLSFSFINPPCSLGSASQCLCWILLFSISRYLEHLGSQSLDFFLYTHILMISSIPVCPHGLIESIPTIHIHIPSLDLSSELQTHTPNYLIAFLNMPYQNRDSCFLLSNVLFYPCYQFHLIASLPTQFFIPLPQSIHDSSLSFSKSYGFYL